MRTTYALLLAGTTAIVSAQPTLTNGSADPSPGDNITLSQCDFVSPGPSGAGITWDHSSLNITSTNTSSYVAAASTGLGGTYPNATVAYDGGGGTYLFYREDVAGFEQDGFVLTGYSATCSDRTVLLPYPLSFGGSWTDNGTCSVTDGSSTWARTSSVSGDADGWGNLILPYGTVSNVLRVHWTENMVDNQYDPPSTTDFNYHSWYRPGVPGPVFSTVVIEGVVFSFPFSDSSSTVIDAGAIGVEELLRHDIGVAVMPNPAQDRAEVVFGLGTGRLAMIDVLDVEGRIVRTINRSTRTTGPQREVIDLAGIPAGAYLVRVTDDTGALGMRRFVKI